MPYVLVKYEILYFLELTRSKSQTGHTMVSFTQQKTSTFSLLYLQLVPSLKADKLKYVSSDDESKVKVSLATAHKCT